jgi:DNA-binding beta-propeller fold protein YncE
MRSVIAARRMDGRPTTARVWLVAGALAAMLLAPSGAFAAGSVYVGNGVSGATLATFPIDAGGALAAQASAVSDGGFVFGVAVAPNGQELYTTDAISGMVSALSIAGGGTPILQTEAASGADAGSSPNGIAVASNGQELYVANYAAGTISTFTIGPDGTLTQQGTSVPSGANSSSDPVDVAVAPNGQELYATNTFAGTVSTFSIGAGGALTQLGTGLISGTARSSAPSDVAVSPDGQELYVTNSGAGTVSSFSIGAEGVLTQQGTGALVASNPGSLPASVAVSPDAGPSAAFTATPARVGTVSVFNAQASSAGSAPIASYTWQFGDGSSASGALVDHVFATAGPYKVTLALTDTDSCSVFGPFTGQTAFCTADPAASSSQTITIPAPASTTPAPASTTPAPASTIPAPPAPSNAFSVVSHKIARNGTITLLALTHAPGALAADATFVLNTKKKTGKGHHRTTRTVHKTITYAAALTTGSGTLTVTLHPGAIARGLIKSRHTLKLTLALSFKPTGGTTNTPAPLTLSVKPPPLKHHR